MDLLPLQKDAYQFTKFPEQIKGIKKIEEVRYHLMSPGDECTNLFLVYTEERVFCWSDRTEEIIAQAESPEELIGIIIDLFDQEDGLSHAIEILEEYRDEKAL